MKTHNFRLLIVNYFCICWFLKILCSAHGKDVLLYGNQKTRFYVIVKVPYIKPGLTEPNHFLHEFEMLSYGYYDNLNKTCGESSERREKDPTISGLGSYMERWPIPYFHNGILTCFLSHRKEQLIS